MLMCYAESRGSKGTAMRVTNSPAQSSLQGWTACIALNACQHEEAKLESKQAPRQDLVWPPCRSEASGKSPDAWRAGALGTGQR